MAAMLKENQPIPDTVVEDLMKDHGLLNRILLIYDEMIIRLESNKQFDPNLILLSAYLVRVYIEDFHEEFEEHYIFQVFIDLNQKFSLVKDLWEQHDLGRILTNRIIHLSLDEMNQHNKKELINCITIFTKMYRIHEAREDTVLFPFFKKLITLETYQELSHKFKEIEEQKFGKNGFQKFLMVVERIEKALDIYHISKISKVIGNYLAVPCTFSKENGQDNQNDNQP